MTCWLGEKITHLETMNTKANTVSAETSAGTTREAGSAAKKLDSLAEVVVRLRELPLDHALRSAELAAQRKDGLAEIAAGRLRSSGRWKINLSDDSRLLA